MPLGIIDKRRGNKMFRGLSSACGLAENMGEVLIGEANSCKEAQNYGWKCL